jgi:hypothetical protein
MKYLSLYSILLCIFLFLCVFKVSASAPQITSFPSETIALDQEFTLSATMSGLQKNTKYRLRVALSEVEKTDYFGSTYDGTTWHAGSIASGNFVIITTDDTGTWGGNVIGKVQSTDTNLPPQSVSYVLKLGRYTETGSSATWSDPVSVTLILPSPTPLSPTATPTPKSATPTPTVKLSPTPKPITPTPTPTQKPVPSMPTKVQTLVSAQDIQITILPTEISSVSAQEEVLGTSSADSAPTPTSTMQKDKAKPPVIFMVLGSIIVCAAGGGIVYLRKHYGNTDNTIQS